MDSATQTILNGKLFEAIGNSSVAAVAELLDRGADINARHCEDGCRHSPLMEAAVKGYAPVIQLLLERGADTMQLASEKKTAAELAMDSQKPEAAALIKAFEERKNPDKVIFSDQIGDRCREDIYDFTRLERVTLIRQSRYGAVESAVITGFSAIEDHSDGSMLRKAFNEHVGRGGKTPEAAVFPNRMYKPKLFPGSGGR